MIKLLSFPQAIYTPAEWNSWCFKAIIYFSISANDVLLKTRHRLQGRNFRFIASFENWQNMSRESSTRQQVILLLIFSFFLNAKVSTLEYLFLFYIFSLQFILSVKQQGIVLAHAVWCSCQLCQISPTYYLSNTFSFKGCLTSSVSRWHIRLKTEKETSLDTTVNPEGNCIFLTQSNPYSSYFKVWVSTLKLAWSKPFWLLQPH